jgi:hypothetical protein
VGISGAARIQTIQLANTLSHLGELANSTEEVKAKLQDDLLGSLAARETSHNKVKPKLQENASTGAAHGMARHASNRSRVNATANLNRSGGQQGSSRLEKAESRVLDDASTMQSFLQVLHKHISHLSTEVQGIGVSGVDNKVIFGLLGVSACLIAFCVAGFFYQERQLISSPTENGRQQYVYKERVIYEWEQTPHAIRLFTQLPRGVKKSDVEVKIWPKHLKIAIYGKQPFIKEELFSLVDVSQSAWTISWNGELAVCMQKALDNEEWPCVIEAHNPNGDEVSDS